MEIRSYKLTCGVEVIGYDRRRVVNDRDEVTAYRIGRPHTFQFQPMPDGHMGLALIPWCFANPTIEDVEIPAREVVFDFAPSEQVEKQFMSQTSRLHLV